MAKPMEFKSLRESIEARLKALTAPGVKQTEAVMNARKKMEAMLMATEGLCPHMTIAVEDE